MSISEFNGPKPPPEPETSTIGAGSEIYRRLERRQKPSGWKLAIPAIALVVAAGAGGLAYQAMNKPTPAPAPMATPPQAMAVNTPPPAPPIQTPTLVQAPGATPAPPPMHEARAEPVRTARVVRHRATSAASEGINADAYAPRDTTGSPAPQTPPTSDANPATIQPPPAPETATPAPAPSAPAPSNTSTSSPTSSSGQ